jgi:hypothetical protein
MEAIVMICNVFAIDPGVTTGWCYVKEANMTTLPMADAALAVVAGQMGGDENQQALDLMKIIAHVWPCAVVVEDFVPQMLNKDRWFLSPTRITAKLELLLWQADHHMLQQMPSLAKSTITDDYLKTCGHYRSGKPHANDAIRHAMTYLRRVKQQPLLHSKLLEPVGINAVSGH